MPDQTGLTSAEKTGNDSSWDLRGHDVLLISPPPVAPTHRSLKSARTALSRRKPGPNYPLLVPPRGGPRLSPGKCVILSLMNGCFFPDSPAGYARFEM